MLLIQGAVGELSTRDLVEKCIKWPNEQLTATNDNGGGFPPGSSTVALLRSLLSDEAIFDAAQRKSFLRWVTGLDVLPDAGLVGTDGGKIRIKYDDPETPRDPREERWPLPSASTCFHTVTLANFSNREVLRDKLLTAMPARHFEEKE
jgi:hypothetical protein